MKDLPRSAVAEGTRPGVLSTVTDTLFALNSALDHPLEPVYWQTRDNPFGWGWPPARSRSHPRKLVVDRKPPVGDQHPGCRRAGPATDPWQLELARLRVRVRRARSRQ